jgi:hypothetical protein
MQANYAMILIIFEFLTQKASIKVSLPVFATGNVMRFRDLPGKTY